MPRCLPVSLDVVLLDGIGARKSTGQPVTETTHGDLASNCVFKTCRIVQDLKISRLKTGHENGLETF